MHQQTSPPVGTPAAPTIASEPPLEQRGDWLASQAGEERQREQLIATAGASDAARQLPRWSRVLDHTCRALGRLAGNEPVDPNDPDIWRSRDQHAQAVLRRHQLGGMSSTRLTLDAVRALIDGQAQADRDAELDWTRLTVSADELDEALRRAHARLPIDLEDPSIYAYRDTSDGRSQGDSASRAIGPGTCRAGCSPTRTNSTRATCGAGESPRRPGWRAPTSNSPRSVTSSNQSACSSCPRSAAPRAGSWSRCCRWTRSG